MPLIGVVTNLFPVVGEFYRGRAIYETIRCLRSYADVEVILPEALYSGARPSTLPELEVTVTRASYRAVPVLSRPVNGSACAAAIYPHLEKLQCDIVLSYWLYPDCYAAVKVAKSLRRPVIVCARGSDLRRISDPMVRRLVTRTVIGADYMLTVSEDLRRRAIDMGAEPNRTRTVLNGCDHTVFRHVEQARAREQLKVDPDAQIVLYVGRLVAFKGVLDLLTAFQELSRNNPRLQLVCIGVGALERRLEAFRHRSEAAGRIHHIGPLEPRDVARWMQVADVLCLPSYSEGCPNVVIEAISSGCPVVASAVGGTTEVLPSECGILVPPGDRATLAQALSNCLARPWDRRMISQAFTRTWDDVARETYDVCRDRIRPVRKRLAPARPLKVTVVTPYFPTAENSYRGHTAFQTLLRLRKHAEVPEFFPEAGFYAVGPDIQAGGYPGDLLPLSGDSLSDPAGERFGLQASAGASLAEVEAGRGFELLALSGGFCSGSRWTRVGGSGGSSLDRFGPAARSRLDFPETRAMDRRAGGWHDHRQRGITPAGDPPGRGPGESDDHSERLRYPAFLPG
jgi:teichuronic acid biosynthesis glycosyltransferase TuaC